MIVKSLKAKVLKAKVVDVALFKETLKTLLGREPQSYEYCGTVRMKIVGNPINGEGANIKPSPNDPHGRRRRNTSKYKAPCVSRTGNNDKCCLAAMSDHYSFERLGCAQCERPCPLVKAVLAEGGELIDY